MRTLKILFIIFPMLLMFLLSCSNEPGPVETNEDVLSNEYQGYLKLNFTNSSLPSFDETTQVDVHVYKNGDMTIASGTLSYNAEEDNGQSKIKRVGTLTLHPTGKYFDNNGVDYLDVKENTNLNETMTVWYWNPQNQTWVQALNENITDTWNGGLAFKINDAVISESIVSVVTTTGSVIWSLHLDVIP